MTFPATHPALANALAAREYTVPTAVQLAVLEAGATARDLLVSARTGSGKTVAFGLVMAGTLLGTDERFDTAGRPLALIIAPTRELALQVQRELDWLYAGTGARVVTCVGGMDPRVETRDLANGAHIVVGTPGRLRDHLERGRLNLGGLKTVVIDEADEMLDLGFREDLEFILDATPDGRQTLLFSATVPRSIETLARRYQSEAVRIEAASPDEQHSDIEYHALRVGPGEVEKAVVNVLRYHEARAALVFCATREGVKHMHAKLLARGFSAVALSGELTQNERTHALEALRLGRARVLVATDVAARGLDLPDLALVIHAELPNDPETLLHRSGRTGRAGRKGVCMLVVPHSRRRKAEALLFGAKLRVRWGAPPTADEIATRDRERFLADPVFAEPPAETEQSAVRDLQASRSADEIALALIRLQRARLPAPSNLAPDTGPPARRPDKPRADSARPSRIRPDRPPAVVEGQSDAKSEAQPQAGRHTSLPLEQRQLRSPRPPRVDDREMVWFRLNIGRNQNADPRWLLPLICESGGVTKSEIGAIRIFDRDTRFEIAADAADQFALTVRTNKGKKGHISRVGTATEEDDAAVAETIAALVIPVEKSPEPAGPTETATRPSPSPSRQKSPARQKEHWRDRKPPRPEGRSDTVRHARPDRAPREGAKAAGKDESHGSGARHAPRDGFAPHKAPHKGPPKSHGKPGSKPSHFSKGKPSGFAGKPHRFTKKKPGSDTPIAS